jgi:hypothetical protein
LNTLIITDLDAKDAAGASVPPVRGSSLKSRNETLKTWVPAVEDLDTLLDKKPGEIVLNDPSGYGIRVAYQQPISTKFKSKEDKEALANTFEDALVYENLDLFQKMGGTGLMGRIRKSLDAASDLGDLAPRMRADLAKGGKAEFIMDLLDSDEIDTMKVPAYIDGGLRWLGAQLKRKEDGISGKAPEAAEVLESAAETTKVAV